MNTDRQMLIVTNAFRSNYMAENLTAFRWRWETMLCSRKTDVGEERGRESKRHTFRYPRIPTTSNSPQVNSLFLTNVEMAVDERTSVEPALEFHQKSLIYVRRHVGE